MRNANQETIADIVAAMRNEGHAGDESCLEWVGAKIRGYADRIEAAAKREREAGAEAAQICGEIGEMIGREATREKSSQVGNTEKMSEALDKLVNFLRWEYAQDYPVSRDKLADAIDIGVSALAATPRNCDIGTALEQVSRHRIWCKCGGDCAVSGKMCCAKWSQMPYEEGGAK